MNIDTADPTGGIMCTYCAGDGSCGTKMVVNPDDTEDVMCSAGLFTKVAIGVATLPML